MVRSVATALVGTAVLAVLAGCAQQTSFGLPALTPQGAAPGVQVTAGYGSGAGYGYGYGNGYQPGYGYADPYFAGQGPYPYGYYRSPYNSYHPQYIVVTCPDSNRDGRCDNKPPKGHDHHGNGDHDGNGGHDGDQVRDDPPVRPHDPRGVVPNVGISAELNTVDRARRGVAPVAQPQAAPVAAPVVQQPVRVRPEPRRAIPAEGVAPRGPRAGSGRAGVTGDDPVPVRTGQEP